MAETSEEELEQATKEYMEAVGNYHRLLDKHFPVNRDFLAMSNQPQEEISDEVLKEIDDARAKANESMEKWITLTEGDED